MRKWNCDTGLVVGEPWKGEGGGIFVLALSPNGKVIACGREDGSIQRWTTDGKMIECVWAGHGERVWSLSWSPSGKQLANGSEDGTILIRKASSGKVKVDPIQTEQDSVRSLAYSPSGKKIASGGSNKTICIWNKKTGKRAVGPIEDQLGFPVTSLVWSSDSRKLYSASDKFARVFKSKSGELLHRFEHDRALYAVALSPTQNVLACVGTDGIAQLWDTETNQALGLPLHEDHTNLFCVSFSRDGKYMVYGGDYGKLILWMVKDIVPQIRAPTLVQKSNRRSTQQEIRFNSPSSSSSSSCLDVDNTGGDGLIEEAHSDHIFQSSRQHLRSLSPGFHLPSLFSAHPLWNVIFRRHPLPDEFVPQEPSKRGFFSRCVRSNSSLDIATMAVDQPEGKLGEGEGDRSESIGDHGHSAPERIKKNEMNLSPTSGAHHLMIALPPPTSIAKIIEHSWNDCCSLEGTKPMFGSLHSSTRPENGPQPILGQPWYRNSSLFSARSSKRPVDVTTSLDEDRHAIDIEAAAAMPRMNDDAVDSSARLGQQVPRGRPTQTQTLTSEPEQIGMSCCGFFFSSRGPILS